MEMYVKSLRWNEVLLISAGKRQSLKQITSRDMTANCRQLRFVQYFSITQYSAVHKLIVFCIIDTKSVCVETLNQSLKTNRVGRKTALVSFITMTEGKRI